MPMPNEKIPDILYLTDKLFETGAITSPNQNSDFFIQDIPSVRKLLDDAGLDYTDRAFSKMYTDKNENLPVLFIPEFFSHERPTQARYNSVLNALRHTEDNPYEIINRLNPDMPVSEIAERVRDIVNNFIPFGEGLESDKAHIMLKSMVAGYLAIDLESSTTSSPAKEKDKAGILKTIMKPFEDVYAQPIAYSAIVVSPEQAKFRSQIVESVRTITNPETEIILSFTEDVVGYVPSSQKVKPSTSSSPEP